MLRTRGKWTAKNARKVGNRATVKFWELSLILKVADLDRLVISARYPLGSVKWDLNPEGTVIQGNVSPPLADVRHHDPTQVSAWVVPIFSLNQRKNGSTGIFGRGARSFRSNFRSRTRLHKSSISLSMTRRACRLEVPTVALGSRFARLGFGVSDVSVEWAHHSKLHEVTPGTFSHGSRFE